jgi:hypothetical protein
MRYALALIAAAFFCASRPANATIVWQQTFAPDPSGETVVDTSGFPGVDLGDPKTSLILQVMGGDLSGIDWFVSGAFQYEEWDFFYPSTYILNGDSLNNEIVYSVNTDIAKSVLKYFPAGDFNECFGSLFHYTGGYCASKTVGIAAINDVVIDTQTGFTLTLSQDSSLPVPEPSAWLMLLAGIGGLGAFVRTHNRRIRLA